MKLTNGTHEVLASFATVNPSLLIPEGNIVRTIDAGQTMVGRATLANNFETQMAIYDLPNFIQVVKLFKDADISLNDDFAIISAPDAGKVKYIFAHPNVINSPTEDVKFPESDITFLLTSSMLDRISKAANTMVLNHLVISPDDEGGINLRVANHDNPTSNDYNVKVSADLKTDDDFQAVFHFERLQKLIPMDYQVSISRKLISEFKGIKTAGHDYEVSYHVALAAESEMGE